MADYYDFVLALIPISLLGVSGLLSGVGIALTVAVPVGAAIAAALIGHAMFVRSPVAPSAPAPADGVIAQAAD